MRKDGTLQAGTRLVNHLCIQLLVGNHGQTKLLLLKLTIQMQLILFGVVSLKPKHLVGEVILNLEHPMNQNDPLNRNLPPKQLPF